MRLQRLLPSRRAPALEEIRTVSLYLTSAAPEPSAFASEAAQE